eukprot:COSAG04_NODE_1959_length_5128_cov_5.518393_7_plen_199_part_00
MNDWQNAPISPVEAAQVLETSRELGESADSLPELQVSTRPLARGNARWAVSFTPLVGAVFLCAEAAAGRWSRRPAPRILTRREPGTDNPPDLLLSTLRACPAHALLPCTPRVAPIDATQGALIYTESSRLEAASPNGADLAQDVLSAAEDRIVKAVRLELERHRAAVAADLARHMEQVDRVSQPPPHHHHFAGLRREG